MMAAQISSELRKATTQRSWWVMGLLMVLFSAGLAALYLVIGFVAPLTPQEFDNPTHVKGVYVTLGNQAFILAAIAGALIVTGEYSSKTQALTLLANTSRSQIIGAKILVAVLSAVLWGVITLVVTVAVSAALLITQDYGPLLTHPEILAGLGGALISVALWSIVGVGAGALLKNQLATILVLVLVMYLLVPAFQFVLPDEAQSYLPAQLSDSMVGGTAVTAGGPPILPQGLGIAITAAFAAVIAALGWIRYQRQQID